ncbi:putative manganese-dependent inorganic diphosphatase [Oceanispirochaeta sp. M1]|uniref:putative manganese-dependent inorganic diphosphatase n=1 Tax=Oceanispirochaeta sp. M2 TaxID=2735869 RepID=UPI0021061604|nr:putative manganese-dependent inorganic diphosphatase [Oceanispirochaeta sp. M1]
MSGHKNPDMDSICSAYCYSVLKNRIDPENRYIPIRCGHMNKQTKMVFNKVEAQPPRLMANISPQVSDVSKRDIPTLDVNDPVFTAIRRLDEENISVIPVFADESEFKGIVSIHEISGFLMSDTLEKRPQYRFRINNFKRVLPGYFYRRGQDQEFDAPIMTGAMPYEISKERINEMLPLKPLLVIGMREDILQFAVEEQCPAIILTGMENDEKIKVDFSKYKGTVFISHTDTAETIRLLRLSTPLKNVINKSPEILQSSLSFDEAKKVMVNSSLRGIPVFEDNQFSGIVTRRCFIEKPKKNLILMDHNEIDQSVPGADQTEILEIIDHHRLGNSRTKEPIYVYARPVGSTCTIVYTHFKMNLQEVDAELATLLVSGILSDTVLLKSPTTTDLDRETVKELIEIASLNFEDFGQELFSQNSALEESDPRDILGADFKIYREELNVGISQAEVVTLEDVEDVKSRYMDAMEDLRKKKRLDCVMLLITNVIKVESNLLMTSHAGIEERLIYNKISDQLYNLPGILSRKKQLLPEILRVLEEINK